MTTQDSSISLSASGPLANQVEAAVPSEDDELVAQVQAFLHSKEFFGPLHGFLAKNCSNFTGEVSDENDLKFTEIHNGYVNIVFGMVEKFLQSIGVTSDEFAQVCKRGLASGGRGASVFKEIMKADDFLYFKDKMVMMNRHMQQKAQIEQHSSNGECPDV